MNPAIPKGDLYVSPDFMEAQRFRILRQVMLEKYMADEAKKAFDEFVSAMRYLHNLGEPYTPARPTHTAWIRGLK